MADKKHLLFTKDYAILSKITDSEAGEITMLNHNNVLFISIMQQYQIFQHTVTDDCQ